MLPTATLEFINVTFFDLEKGGYHRFVFGKISGKFHQLPMFSMIFGGEFFGWLSGGLRLGPVLQMFWTYIRKMF